MDQWIIDTEVFVHPFNCIISGPTMGGKTFLLKEILKYKDILIKPSPTNLIYCYKAWQPSYDEIKSNILNIQFVEGLVDTELLTPSVVNLIIFDDLMNECINSNTIMNLFTVGSHHKNTSVFFLSQNIFSKGKFARDITLNSSYMIIFRNPRDQQQVQILARQIYPNNSRFLIDSFEDATKLPYGYLLLDLKQSTETKNRIQTGILPTQQRIIFTMRK
jgi:hypothetical protein